MSSAHPIAVAPAPLLAPVATGPRPVAAASAALQPSAVAEERILILKKSVHPSERQWSRLVVPGAQVHFFQAIQASPRAELKAAGKDINLYIKDYGPTPRTWRWLFRMTVQRPMVLDLQPFYLHHGVNAGDTVCLYRNLATNELTVELLRGAGPPAPPPGPNGSVAAAAAAAAAAMGPQPQPQEPVPPFTCGQLPGLAWALGPRGGKRPAGPAAAHGGPLCSPAAGEEEDDYWGAGADDGDDGDYSPTAKGRGGKRSASGKGPLAVRRALNKPRSGSSDGSDQETYTAEQLARFDALVDVAARLSQPQQLQH
ncbi:hypothetical protein ABPG75_003868 [Micractinium tetrahymenae]